MRISDCNSDVCSSDLLHTKSFVIDGERGFIGSFNLDPRSAYLNTEMGVLFEDDDIARALREEYLFLAGPALSYEVCRDEAGELCWLDRTEDPPLVLHEEPQTTFLQRATATANGWLPLERSEECRVGKGEVSTCRSRVSPET